MVCGPEGKKLAKFSIDTRVVEFLADQPHQAQPQQLMMQGNKFHAWNLTNHSFIFLIHIPSLWLLKLKYNEWQNDLEEDPEPGVSALDLQKGELVQSLCRSGIACELRGVSVDEAEKRGASSSQGQGPEKAAPVEGQAVRVE